MARPARSVKLPRRRTKGPASIELQRSLQGTWTFQGSKVSFRFQRAGSGMRLKLDHPAIMSEQAWRALFKFLLFNFGTLQTKVPAWRTADYVAWQRERRRKRSIRLEG